ncbi:MAG: hypothetical protein ACRCV6_08835 [Formosimonas sp.]
MKVLNRMILLAALVGAPSLAYADVPLTAENTKVTMARFVHQTYGPTHLTEVFPKEGFVYAYVTFAWSEADKSMWGTKLTYKWYSGDKLLKTKEASPVFIKSPFHFWTRMKAVDFATGPAKFEIYDKDKLLVSQKFVVSNEPADYSLKVKIQK